MKGIIIVFWDSYEAINLTKSQIYSHKKANKSYTEVFQYKRTSWKL